MNKIVDKKIKKGLKLSKYNFNNKPLVVGGLAMEYYGLRKTGYDYDYVVSRKDWKELKKLYPNNINLFGGKNEKDVDATINLKDEHVDLISTLFQFNYKDLSKNSIDLPEYKIISLEKLLLLKSLGAVFNNHSKSKKDQKLIIKHIVKIQYSD